MCHSEVQGTGLWQRNWGRHDTAHPNVWTQACCVGSSLCIPGILFLCVCPEGLTFGILDESTRLGHLKLDERLSVMSPLPYQVRILDYCGTETPRHCREDPPLTLGCRGECVRWDLWESEIEPGVCLGGRIWKKRRIWFSWHLKRDCVFTRLKEQRVQHMLVMMEKDSSWGWTGFSMNSIACGGL